MQLSPGNYGSTFVTCVTDFISYNFLHQLYFLKLKERLCQFPSSLGWTI